jgi:L-fuconolactonase
MPIESMVDTHLHLWDPARIRYPWLDQVDPLNRPHLLPDYAAATANLHIEMMVFVQCEADFSLFREEASWVAEQAKIDPRIKGIVAWAPLEQGERARDDLASLKELPLLRGIRRIIQFEADADFCLRPDFIRGVQALADFDLHFEICSKGDAQFANAVELARRCPNVRFMLDHIGKPHIDRKLMEPWRTHLRALASLPNTWCKVSGLVNEADMNQWKAGDLTPYLDAVVDAFGFDRLCFGGDWPVCTLAATYRRWFDTLAAYMDRHSATDRRKLFRDTAVKFYRLETPS